MTYLRYLLFTTILVLAACASINYFVDPANVYHSDQASSPAYADALIKSEFGLWWPENSLEDRDIKKQLSRYASLSECVVVGSSHIMQVGSARTLKSLGDQCSSILNLGVSGASIEDQFVLVYLSLKNGHPKKIVLGVDPWTFAFGKDARWSFYADDYKRARMEILGEVNQAGNENTDALGSKLRNLLSVDYTIRSVQKWTSNLQHDPNHRPLEPVIKINESHGGEYPILFKDGSLLYSAKFLALVSTTRIPLGGVTYATNGVLNDLRAIDAYRLLLLWIKSKGVEPILLMTPYHPNVSKAPESPNARALAATEPIVRYLGSQLDLRVIGTYNPVTAECMDTEFYDFMHASPECLSKLRQQ